MYQSGDGHVKVLTASLRRLEQFYAALALLQNIGKVPSKHVGVISLFDTEFVGKEIFPKGLSRDFHKAFEMRQIADYKIIESVSPEKARESLVRAYSFVEAVKKYIQNL